MEESEAHRKTEEMPTQIEGILEALAKARRGLLQAADAISGEVWMRSPGEGRWSAAELIAHLIQVERGVLAKADRIIQHSPKAVPLLKKMHLPMVLVEARIGRRKSPIPVTAESLGAKEEMMGELRSARERTYVFLGETSGRELGEYYWAHPALGMLNVYGWMRFLAAHEIRHTKQMREIGDGLQKPIGNFQE